MSGSAPVAVDVSGPVWTLTLDRPLQGNACSSEMVAALEELLRRAEREQPMALVLQAEGRHFCTGFDFSAIADECDDMLLARFVRIELLLQRVARAPLLTVAVAHGRAIGAGADLYAACAVRLVRGEASFAFPGARGFGLVLGTRRLCAAVGSERALEWIESGRTVPTAEAVEAGLVHRVLDAAGSADVLGVIGARLHEGLAVRGALRRAAAPNREIEDALDLRRLVESAARPGLRDRIEAYAQRVRTLRSQPAHGHPSS